MHKKTYHFFSANILKKKEKKKKKKSDYWSIVLEKRKKKLRCSYAKKSFLFIAQIPSIFFYCEKASIDHSELVIVQDLFSINIAMWLGREVVAHYLFWCALFSFLNFSIRA